MKTMAWDGQLWRKLKDAVSPMPVFIRRRALKTIIEAAEQLARERGSSEVQQQDLVEAALHKTPRLARRTMLAALVEQGIEIESREDNLQGQ